MSIKKEHLTFSMTAVIMFFLLTFFMSFSSVLASEEYDEGEDTVISSEEYDEGEDTVISSDEYNEGTDISYDDLITGTMDKFSKSMIVVDGARYSLCKDLMVYNTANTLIPLKDIDAAIEVKLFINKGCVIKISVLRFAH